MKPFQRIVVVGVTGSGKTTFARALATRLACTHIELDALHWLPGWQEKPADDFRRDVAEATATDQWVIDGNYSVVRDIVWGRAQAAIWLDYPLRLILWRLMRRTTRRLLTQEEIWNGNRETLRNQLRSDSLFIWALRTYPKYQRTYPVLFEQPEYQHLTVIRLTSPQAAEKWLEEML